MPRARVVSRSSLALRRVVGAAIRSAREARGWTQARLAAACGVTGTAVSRWETGDRALSVDDLSTLAEVLREPAASLLARRAA